MLKKDEFIALAIIIGTVLLFFWILTHLPSGTLTDMSSNVLCWPFGCGEKIGELL